MRRPSWVLAGLLAGSLLGGGTAQAVVVSPDAADSEQLTLVDKIQERLLVYHGFMQRIGQVVALLQADRDPAAYQHAQRAALWLLPLHRGQFSPYSTLADLIILLGLRAPALWLALWIVRDLRSWTRIVEYLVTAYAFAMLMLSVVLTAPTLQIQLVGLTAVALGAGLLLSWVLALGPRRTLLALLLALAFNVAVEFLFVTTGYLSSSVLLAKSVSL